MTKEEILAMEAGKELDTLVAQKVMGHPMPDFIPEDALDLYLAGAPIHYDSWTCVCYYDEGDVPKWVPDPYSGDISAAWQVVEKLIKKGYFLVLQYGLFQKGWGCTISKQLPANNPVRNIETAPEAICKAALIATDAGK